MINRWLADGIRDWFLKLLASDVKWHRYIQSTDFEFMQLQAGGLILLLIYMKAVRKQGRFNVSATEDIIFKTKEGKLSISSLE